MSADLRCPDVAIVGGGSIGLVTALELARRGLKPVVFERAGDLLTSCSAGSAGLLSPAHSTPLPTPSAVREGLRYMARRDSPFSMRIRPALIPWLLRFMVAARSSRVRAGTDALRELSFSGLALHEKFASDGLDTGLRARGALNVYETDQGFEAGKAEAEALAAQGSKSDVLTREQARDLEPALSDRVVGGVFYPDEAQCDPERFLRAIAKAAVDAGAVILTRAEVFGVRLNRTRVEALETAHGDVMPRHVVVANGAWAAEMGRHVGRPIPIEGAKGYHVDLERASSDPSIPVYMQEARVIATPFEDRLRLSGTLQLTGLDMGLDRVRAMATLEAGTRTLREISRNRVTEVWRGIRPCAPDGLPVIGRSGGIENMIFATGHAMKGLHLAPTTACLVADLLTGTKPAIDMKPFRPDRFRALFRRRNGRTVNAGPRAER
ncbi:MAG: NAD(P)/FAD-dependent oxidoreductase [Solirubrobacterales bacterium]